MAKLNVGKAFAAAALSAVGIMFAVAAGACSAEGNNGGDTSNSGTNGAGSSGGNDDGGLFGSSSGVGQDGGFIDGGCASSQSKAQQVPLDMYIMLDQSGSMSDAAGNSTKWEATVAALKAFFQQPEAAGIGVGIQYFPLTSSMQCPVSCATDADCGACGPCVPFFGICAGAGGGDSCNVDDYAKPEVEIAPLPGVSAALNMSLANHSPSGGTPTSAALDGTIKHAKDWAIAHPDHVAVAVFATDGDPSSCDTDLATINAIAAAGANGVPKILTFVIGVGSSLNALNGIAASGGTNQAFLVDANANATQQFLDAMNEIRGSALACAYLIPQPAMGELDYDAVNVQYLPVGGQPELIPKVEGKQQCPASGKAWYYDNNATPKQIIMCDAACEAIKMDKDGEVSVIFGCKTIVN